MSSETLQPSGLVDAENHVFLDKLGISTMQFYINTCAGLPVDYLSFFAMFTEGSDLRFLASQVAYQNIPESAIRLFASYKVVRLLLFNGMYPSN